MPRPICNQCGKRPCEIASISSQNHSSYRSVCWKCRSQKNPNYKAHFRKSQQKTKAEVIAKYGGQCACCGEKTLAFLTIDHIYGQGNQHRKRVGISGGYMMCRWLRQHNYPQGFQVLCFNCNCGRQVNGGVCPHNMGASSK